MGHFPRIVPDSCKYHMGLSNSIKVRGKGKNIFACITRTARKHEALMARNMMSNHTDMQDKYCGDCYDIHPIQSQYTKVAACGRHHKRGDAAFGRATSFVVSFVLAFNRANLVAVNAILVLHVGKTGRRTVGRTPLGLHVPSRCDTTMDDQDKSEL